MTIGDGLLYSTILVLLFATVWLASKHRAWKKIGKIAAFIAIGCVAIGLAIWGWATYSNRPLRMDALEGIAVGMSLGDVQVKKGATSRIAKNADGKIDMLVYQEAYSEDLLAVLLREANNDQVVLRICKKGTFYAFGLSEYADEVGIRQRLGEPSASKILEDNLTKRLTYEKLNVWFDIEKNKVSAFCVGLG